MEVCRICKGNCDHGELVGGICPECREEERKRQEKTDTVARMMNSSFYQIKLGVKDAFS